MLPLPQRGMSAEDAALQQRLGRKLAYTYSHQRIIQLARFSEPLWKSAGRFFILSASMPGIILALGAIPLSEHATQHMTWAVACHWCIALATITLTLRATTKKLAAVCLSLPACFAICIAASVFAACVMLLFDVLLGIFPVPFASVIIGSPSALLMLSIAYASLPPAVRNSPERRRILLWSWLIVLVLLGFAFFCLLFRALFNVLQDGAQAIMVVLLPLWRFGSQRALEALTRRLAPDGSLDAPVAFVLKHFNALFAATLFSAAGGISSALLVLQEMLGSVAYLLKMANAYNRAWAYISCASRRNRVTPMALRAVKEEGEEEGEEGGEEKKRKESTCDDGTDSKLDEESGDVGDSEEVGEQAVLDALRDALTPPAAQPGWRHAVLYSKKKLPRSFRRALRTSGFLAVEELVESIVALQWMAMLSFYYHYSKDAMYVIRDMSDADYSRTMQVLAISASAEVALLCVASVVCYRRFGISLLHHASFLLAENFAFLSTGAGTLTIFAISLLYRYNGFGLLVG
eukprot:PLAT7057.2.p1 GENE.PLAT7057.2~~PLAT7057.2.p1  ORF type:complete len:584 (+),score=120.90 PLAT7057.2:198-1754(+)